jgi:hypothetical protein
MRQGGPLTLDQALDLVRSRGVRVPNYLSWVVAEEEGVAPEDCGLANADAMYYRIDQSPLNADFPVTWGDFTVRGKVPVWLRREVLRSEDHSLYVFSHEIFEIRQLKKVIADSGGGSTLRRLCYLIDPAHNGATHLDAIRSSDALVDKLRKEWGIGP